MGTVIAAVMVFLIVVGSMLAMRGGEVLRGFVRLMGGSFLGGAGAYLGFRIGELFGGEWTMAYALSMGALGFLVGFLFGTKLLQIVLTVTVFVLGAGVGYFVAEELGGDGSVPFLAGVVVGVVGAWVLSSIARRLLLAATITFGSTMVSAGILVLLLNDISVEEAGLISFGAFIVLSLAGFLLHRGEISGMDDKR
ncbi:MAG: hypothetical protein JXA22_10775 [Candidatus Thermoplasmatota archaeon]|nr:hypothetical protein [Candidatus Thermoplasmatota archaeon]